MELVCKVEKAGDRLIWVRMYKNHKLPSLLYSLIVRVDDKKHHICEDCVFGYNKTGIHGCKGLCKYLEHKKEVWSFVWQEFKIKFLDFSLIPIQEKYEIRKF